MLDELYYYELYIVNIDTNEKFNSQHILKCNIPIISLDSILVEFSKVTHSNIRLIKAYYSLLYRTLFSRHLVFSDIKKIHKKYAEFFIQTRIKNTSDNALFIVYYFMNNNRSYFPFFIKKKYSYYYDTYSYLHNIFFNSLAELRLFDKYIDPEYKNVLKLKLLVNERFFFSDYHYYRMICTSIYSISYI